VTFRDKMEIHLGSKKVELWYFGVGHTTGGIVVYFPDEKTASIGDRRSPNGAVASWLVRRAAYRNPLILSRVSIQGETLMLKNL